MRPGCERSLIGARRQWQRAGGAHAGDPRQRSERGTNAILNCDRIGSLRHDLGGHRHTERQDARCTKSGIGDEQTFEAADDECSCTEQDERKTDLRRDQASSHAAMPAAASHGTGREH